MTHNNHSNCLLFSFSAIFLLMLQPVFLMAQKDEADQLVEQNKARYGNNMVVYATQHDSVLYKKETGEFNINTQVPVGAASSWFTAALVMWYVDQKKISLDDPVAKYLPIFGKYAKKYLTIRHCLSNTTGLEAEKGGVQKFFQKTKFETLEEKVNSYASRHEIVSNPGQQFSYDNIGINIAGRVLEIVGKKGFDRLVLEKIFRPVGMKKSTFTSERAVDPYAGAFSSASDYTKFLTMLLNKGTYNGKKILSENAVHELETVMSKDIPIAFVPELFSGYEYAPGSWVLKADSHANPEVLTSPGILGTWPFLDLCRGYAAIVLVPQRQKEDKKDFYLQMKEALDELAGKAGCE